VIRVDIHGPHLGYIATCTLAVAIITKLMSTTFQGIAEGGQSYSKTLDVRSVVPLQVHGDGKCLYHVVSISA
jgi:hypothetical protein